MVYLKVPEGYSFPDDASEGKEYSEMVTCRYDKDKGYICLEKLAGHSVEEDEDAEDEKGEHAKPVDDGTDIQNSGGYADAVAKAMPSAGAGSY